eukprot:scaffold852_cov197-Alexandrium_tamarense.AAC.13
MGNVLRKLLDVFFTKKLDLVVIGLENSGKTTLLHALAHGQPGESVRSGARCVVGWCLFNNNCCKSMQFLYCTAHLVCLALTHSCLLASHMPCTTIAIANHNTTSPNSKQSKPSQPSV